jgi:hypothetical protein
LLQQGEVPTVHAILAAIQSNTFARSEDDKDVFKETEESLALILRTGIDPNLRLDDTDETSSRAKAGWATGNISMEREFLCNWR